MKNIYRSLALALVALLTVASGAFAQDVAAKFAELAPKMTPENFSVEQQVKEMEAAQQEWMRICLQNQDIRKETNALMLDALKADYPVTTKAWLLHILGWVGDDSCVDGISAFLLSDEAPLFDESARALAHIASDKAIDALKAASAKADDPAKFESFIKARDYDISVGAESEAPLDLPYVSDADFDAYMSGFDKLDADGQARALAALRVRKTAKYVDLAVKALDSDNEDVRKAGLLALEKIATAKQFDALKAQLSKQDRGLVVRVMRNVPGDDFDKAAVDALKKEKNGDDLGSLAEIVGGRYIADALGAMLDAAKKDDCPARFKLIESAEALATKDNIGDFVDVFVALPGGAESDRAQQIIARLCEGDATPVIKKITNDTGVKIFPLLGRIGGKAAKDQIDAGLKASDPNMVALSIRALCNWPNAEPYKQLFEIAKNKKYPEPLRIQALRAYIRVISLPDDQDGIDMKDDDKVDCLEDAFEIALRDDERNFVLERLGSVRDEDSVEFALKYVDDPKLKNKAINAILDLAHQDYLRKQHKELFLKALDVVLEKGDQGQKDRAGGYKSNIR